MKLIKFIYEKYRQLRFSFRIIFINKYFFYIDFARILHRDRILREVATKKHDLIIESFPRSGNSFLFHLIEASSSTKLRIGHHLHSAQHVHFGIKYNIPSVVIIRKPEDAIISYAIFQPLYTFNQIFKYYLLFYNCLRSVKNQIIIVKFDNLIDFEIKNISRIIDLKIDDKNSIKKEVFQRLDNINKQVNKLVNFKTVSKPNTKRTKLKNKYLDIYHSKKYDDLRKLANEIYIEFTT